MVQDIEKGIQSHSQWSILYLSFWLGGLLGCGSCAYLMTPSPEHSERRDAPIRDANFPTFGCIGCEIYKAPSQIQIWLILIPKMHWLAFKEGVLKHSFNIALRVHFLDYVCFGLKRTCVLVLSTHKHLVLCTVSKVVCRISFYDFPVYPGGVRRKGSRWN